MTYGAMNLGSIPGAPASTSLFKVDWASGIVGATLSVLIGFWLLASPWGFGLRALSFDSLSTLPAGLKPREALIVYMDDESHNRLQQSRDKRWDRSLHARLLKELTNRGAKAVVFDIVFSEPSADERVDRQLAEAMRRHGKVATAADLETSRSANGMIISQLVPPTGILMDAASWGIAGFPKEKDGIIRREASQMNHPDLPQAAARLIGQRREEKSEPAHWVRFYGGHKIPHLSYYQFFEPGALSGDICSNKVIFVGAAPSAASPEVGDVHRIPDTRWTGKLCPGVDLDTTVFLNLLRREWLREASPRVEWGLIMLMGIIFGFGITIARPLTACWISLLGISFIVAGAYVVWQFGVWLPWLIIAAVQIPVALCWALLAHTRRAGTGSAYLARYQKAIR